MLMTLNREALLSLVNSCDRVTIDENCEPITVEGSMMYRLRGVIMDMEDWEHFSVTLFNHELGQTMLICLMSQVNRDWVLRGIGGESLVGEEELALGTEYEALIH